MTEEESPKPADLGAASRAEVEAAAGEEPPEALPVGESAESPVAPEARSEVIPAGLASPEASALEGELSPENRNRFSGLPQEERSILGRAWNSVRDALDDPVTSRIKLWGSRMISEYLGNRASSGIEKATKLRDQATSEAVNIARELEQAKEEGLLEMNPDLEGKVKAEHATAESRAAERTKEIERLKEVRVQHQERHQELVKGVTERWETKVASNQKEISVRSEGLHDLKLDIAGFEADLKIVNDRIKKFHERIGNSTSTALKEEYMKQAGVLADQAKDIQSGLAFHKQEELVEKQAVAKLEQTNSKLRERVAYARGEKRPKSGKESGSRRTASEAEKEGAIDANAEAKKLSVNEVVQLWNKSHKYYSVKAVEGVSDSVDIGTAVRGLSILLENQYKTKFYKLPSEIETFKRRLSK